MADENMDLWNSVVETDPAITKQVAYGKRKFTTMDAYNQIRRATELWGPVGVGWGWDATFAVYDGVCFATIVLWHSSDRSKYFTTVGSAKMGNDGEAPKKALTDGITKGLSYVGFNADVFLGKFDDNKYVAAMNAKYGNTEGAGRDGTPEADMDHNGEQYPEEIF